MRNRYKYTNTFSKRYPLSISPSACVVKKKWAKKFDLTSILYSHKAGLRSNLYIYIYIYNTVTAIISIFLVTN